MQSLWDAMPLFPSPCSSWCVGSYDSLPALMSSLEQSLLPPLLVCRLLISPSMLTFLSIPLCVHSLIMFVHLLATLPVCVLIPFSLWKVPMMHGASPAAVSAATTSATSVPFASASANQVCSFMAFSLSIYLSLSHTHTHTLSTFLFLSDGCFWVPGALYSDLSPLLAYTGFW